MKHKLTVLACVGLALLLSSGVAFASNSGGLGHPNGQQNQGIPRCATIQVPIFLNTTSSIGGWGLPLTISGGATILSATPTAALAGCLTGVGGFPGTTGVVNFSGCCLPPGNYPALWILTIQTPSTCQGDIVIDTAFFPPAGAYISFDCGACKDTIEWFKSTLPLENKPPVCGQNSNESRNFTACVVNKQLNASDPDVCDNPLAYSLANAGGLHGATVSLDGKFNYCASCQDKGVHTVTFRATDQCGASVQCTFTVTVTNTAPVCGTNADVTVYFQTGVVGKQLNASDADGNPFSYSLAAGSPGTVTSAGVYNWATTCADVGTHVISFYASDGCDSVLCTFNVTVFQNAPVCTNPANITINWNAANANVPLVATDDNCKCPLTWTVISAVPAPQNAPTISGSTLTFDPDCADFGKGPITICVRVFDCEKADTCCFTVTVVNPAPVITCPTIPLALLGDLIKGTATGTDADGGKIHYSLLSFVKTADSHQACGPDNAPTVDDSGHFSWQTSAANECDAGVWTACVIGSDECGQKDTCCFDITVLSYKLCVGDEVGTDSIVEVLSGQTATIWVKVSNSYPLGGLDLLLCYDKSGMSFLGATAEGNLKKWEYFTWRFSANSNCTGGCPSGYLRVVAIADLNNGSTIHPAPADFHLDGKIIALKFLVSSDRNFIGQCFRVAFCTLDCGDNTLSSVTGDTLFIPIGSDQSCIDPRKHVARDIISLCDGWICVIPPHDDRGDINLNNIANEVGDAVLFTNYFIYGPDVFTLPQSQGGYRESQILASDVNDDGVPLTVADLIYLIRVITGDAQPFPNDPGNPKMSPYLNSGTANMRVENNTVHVQTNSSVELGGALLVFRYSGMGVGTPVLSPAAANLRMASHAENGELRVLVYAWDKGARVNAGANEILTIPTTGDGAIELADVQMSDASGALLSSSAAKSAVPTEYALLQNYPNPFNAGTVIAFNLKQETDWSLAIYNIAGQTVRTFAGHDAGRAQVAWDGTDNAGTHVASGVYFYRVQAADFTATRKMTLLK
ncbi:MAG: T9SS type A sorting domain-containing protein [candidate division Zixibacteria bacterium]|nr:T9SS type A sorting domain-containing protein [candidate division Zixibacteria bacterium]